MLIRNTQSCCLLLIAILCAPAFAIRDWSLSLPSSTQGSFQAVEQNGTTLSGSIERLNNKFISQNITECSGTNCPPLPVVKFGFEIPGFSFFGQPLLSDESQLISTVNQGTCPGYEWKGIFLFSLWDVNGTNNVSNPYQPVFGTLTYTPFTNSLVIDRMWGLQGYTSIPISPLVLSTQTCANGMVTIHGFGDRGGVLYISGREGAIFRTNGRKSTFAVEQIPIPSSAALDGNYSAFVYDYKATQTIKAFRANISSGSATGSTLTDIGKGTTDPLEIWKITNIQVNTPVNGMFTADLAINTGPSRRMACATYMSQNTIHFCGAQSTSDSTKPMNIVLRSDTAAFGAGAIDTYAFASGGKAIGAIPTVSDTQYPLTPIRLQTNGKILVGVQTPGYQTILRYLKDGSLDTSFSEDGHISFAGPTVHAVAEDGSQGVITVGQLPLNGSVVTRVRRYTKWGGADGAFGNGGVTSIDNVGGAVGVNLDANDRIYVLTSEATAFHICRLSPTGALDTNFGASGCSRVSYQNNLIKPGAYFVLRGDGKVMVGGSIQINGVWRMFASRLNENGSLDTTFSGSGFTSPKQSPLAENDFGNGISVQLDNKIIQSGQCGAGPVSACVVRYNAGGAVDLSFGNSGKFLFGGAGQTANAVAIQDDGKLIVTGKKAGQFFLARLNTNGTLDTTFGSNGESSVSMGVTSESEAITIQSDRKLVISGNVRDSSSTYRIGFARFWP